MTIVSRYVLRLVIGPCLLATAVICFLASANAIRGRSEELSASVIAPTDIVRVALYSLPALISIIVAVTYMFGILMAFGRLSQDGELTAMKAAGIPLKRIVVPVIIAGGLLSFGCFLIQDRLQPWAVDRLFTLVYTELPLRATLDVLPTGVMHEYGGWRVYFGDRDDETETLYDLMIIRPEKNGGGTTVFYAESAEVQRVAGRGKIRLYNGHLIQPGNARSIFEVLEMDLPALAQQKVRSEREGRTLRQLFAMETELERAANESGSDREKAALLKERREIGIRFALPLACLAVAFAAAPLGARAKRGGRSYTFAMGFGLILLFYILQVLCEPPMLLGLWATVSLALVPNLVLVALGFFLLQRVDRI